MAGFQLQINLKKLNRNFV